MLEESEQSTVAYPESEDDDEVDLALELSKLGSPACAALCASVPASPLAAEALALSPLARAGASLSSSPFASPVRPREPSLLSPLRALDVLGPSPPLARPKKRDHGPGWVTLHVSEAPLLCSVQHESLGGCWNCSLPAGHAGPHALPPSKRRRAGRTLDTPRGRPGAPPPLTPLTSFR